MSKITNALIVALNAAAGAPEWLHLLPVGSFTGVDGRGPYQAPNAAALISLFDREGKKLPVDENHSIDLAGKQGHPSPARGWITELQSRDDGIWGKVEWTTSGKAIMDDKSYGYLSPVFMHTAEKPYRILKLARVALTNDPNLDFLTSLHSKQENAMLEQLRKALGLPETATEAEIMAAVTAAHAAKAAHTALVGRIATAAGLAADLNEDALVTAIHTRGKASATEAENADLRSQLTSLQSQLTTLATSTAQEKATSIVTAAVEAGKIVPALKDHMIARHMKNPTEVEAEIKLMPSLNAGGLGGRKQPGSDDASAMTAEDDQIAALMGIDPAAYAKTAKALHGKGN